MSLIILNRDQSRDIKSALSNRKNIFKTFSIYINSRTMDVKIEGKNKYSINGKPVDIMFN